MRTAAFSIISPNYRHFARVLMESLQRHHPEWERFVLLVGETSPFPGAEPFTSVPLEALSLPNPRQFCFRYSLLELNTAVKPWMFEHLFERGFDRVLYFDPDIVLYSALVELDEAPGETFLTLTPHLTGPIGGDEHPSERSILMAGTYNLGFLAVTRQAPLLRFLKWWKEKLELQCVVDPARGLFVDQKWMDLAPGLFPDVRVLRHEGYNVAYWNLRQRTLLRSGASATVNGQPLRFFHFSGFSPAYAALVSRHEHELKVAAVGDAGRLIAEYALALRAAGFDTFKNAPYSFGVFADGSRVPEAARVAYRTSAELQEVCGSDPFQHPERFRAFHDRRRGTLAAAVALRSYRILSRVRPLVHLLPRRLRTRMREFLLGRREQAVRPGRVTTPLRPGLDVVGYFSRDTGVGESARLCVNACEAAGLPVQPIDIDSPPDLGPQPVHRASVIHVNADRIVELRKERPAIFDSGAYLIGCWHWELPELPDAWIAAAEGLDELWAPSAFIQSALSRKVTIPVVHLPHGVDVAEIEACSPQELGVPRGRFTFLCMFDFASVMQRKNPQGAVEAFRRAFGDDPSTALLIKTMGADSHGEAHAALAESVRQASNVYLADRMLSRARGNGLIAACDAVVSLHRAEGFGLILAEAMALGKPAIATGWSGNLDFMNAGNSCPVASELVTLERSFGPYEAGQQWAEPDLDHAAHLMRRVVEDSHFRREIGERARQTMRSQFSPRAAGLRYRQRLSFLGLMDD